MPATILLMDASAPFSRALLRTAAAADAKPTVHAYTEEKGHLPREDAALAASVFEGDLDAPSDILRALDASKADTVVLCVGSRETPHPTDVRYRSAHALMAVLAPGGDHDHVRLVVVSSLGAGGTRILVGFGIGKILTRKLRYVLSDHDRQLDEIWTRLGAEGKGRAWVVHVSHFCDAVGDQVVEFEGKVPSSKVGRAAVARYMLREIESGDKFGGSVCVSGRKARKGKAK